MKKLTLLLAVFNILLPALGSAEWVKVISDTDENVFYVDFEKIRKDDGYINYWYLTDLLKPTNTGYLSAKVYVQGDCKLLRFKPFSASFHKKPMGNGLGHIRKPQADLKNWQYPLPGSASEFLLKAACVNAEKM